MLLIKNGLVHTMETDCPIHADLLVSLLLLGLPCPPAAKRKA